MTKQAVKKGAGIKKFSVQNFKNELLGEVSSKTADKELEWIMMPKAYQEAINLPGIPMGRGVTFIRGWSDTGKSTLKNLAIANAMKQGILPVIFETEGNFDFQYAKDCGMAIEPVYDDVKYTDEETGGITVRREIVDWEGDYFLFTNTKMCEFCGDMDYSTSTRKSKKRKVAVIEDIAYIINTFLDKQDNGEIPMPLLFIWDSVGSIQSYKSYMSKSGNNQFDAGSISTAFKPIFGRISASKEIGSPYTNTFIVINKIWQDVMNSMGGAVSVENSGGKAMFYAARLGLHCGGVSKAATKKLKAVLKGQEYQYGTLTTLSVVKNQLPVITAKDQEIYQGDTFDPKVNVTATDAEDGDLTSTIEIVENTVDTTKIGEYKVIYKVVDSSKDEQIKEIKVTVVERKLKEVSGILYFDYLKKLFYLKLNYHKNVFNKLLLLW